MKIFKKLLLVLLSAFIGIFSNPEMLMASDSVAVTGISPVGIVETVPITEPEPEMVSEPEIYYTDYSYVEAPVYVAPTNYISIFGMTIPLEYTDISDENAGSAQQAWYYKSGKWIYGHNYNYIFGPLDWAYDGGYLLGIQFTVVMGGTVNYYTITDYRLFDFDGQYLYLNGVLDVFAMNDIVNAYTSEPSASHRMAIMTCYAGRSKRLVVYAD